MGKMSEYPAIAYNWFSLTSLLSFQREWVFILKTDVLSTWINFEKQRFLVDTAETKNISLWDKETGLALNSLEDEGPDNMYCFSMTLDFKTWW